MSMRAVHNFYECQNVQYLMLNILKMVSYQYTVNVAKFSLKCLPAATPFWTF